MFRYEKKAAYQCFEWVVAESGGCGGGEEASPVWPPNDSHQCLLLRHHLGFCHVHRPPRRARPRRRHPRQLMGHCHWLRLYGNLLLFFFFLNFFREVLYTPLKYLFTPHLLSKPQNILFAPHFNTLLSQRTLLTPHIQSLLTPHSPKSHPLQSSSKFASLFDLLCLFLHFHR